MEIFTQLANALSQVIRNLMDDFISKLQKSRTVFCPGLSGILATREKVIAGSASGTLRIATNLLSVLLMFMTRLTESSNEESYGMQDFTREGCA